MCVRYTLHKPEAAVGSVAKALGSRLDSAPWAEPRFNIALTQKAPTVARVGESVEVGAMVWGFPGLGAAGLLANAKAETARELPSFREAVRQRRCLVPANGYYEWQTREGAKWPHLFSLADDEPFAFAGLWATRRGDGPATFCILTTRPNERAAEVHTRMPVLLTGEDLREWLLGSPCDEGAWARLTAPVAAERITITPVSTYVSSVRNEGPACHAPVDTRGEQLGLF